MSRRRKLTDAGTVSGGVATVAASPEAEPLTPVMALTECIIEGTRRQVGEWFTVPRARVVDLVAFGYVIPDAYFEAMQPRAAAHWRTAQREGLTGQSLVCDEATAARLWNDAGGRVLTPDGWEATAYEAAPVTDGALRVLQLTQYDPGSSVYRYHSAANTVDGVVSAMVRYGDSNPHCSLRQWDGLLHNRTVELLAMTANVIHCHMDYRALHHDLRYALRDGQRAAITYHGSVIDGDPTRVMVDHTADERMGAMQFGARPYHGRYGVSRYLPIPVPVADYEAAAKGRARGDVLRIAHSPTKRAIKGTTVLLDAVHWLRETEGVRAEVVLIEDMPHGEALRLKATCDVTFDSFWLGMQGSGIEGAAMGQAVIAGDPKAAEEAAALNGGAVPWTFADERYGLLDVIRRLATDATYCATEAARVREYVGRVHDYRAVGAQYRTYLREG
jgi:hypothetical protein